MNHTIWEVLSVWWIVAVFDLSVVYCFVRLAKDKKQVYKMVDNFSMYEYYLLVVGINPTNINEILRNTTVSTTNT